MAPHRKRFIVKGSIQHVGYRALVMAFGERLGIKGFVRNLPDRTVEVVCEGELKNIGMFLKAIDRKGDPLEPLSINVASIAETPPAPEGELPNFVIDYGRELTPVERESCDRDEIMILGAGTLNMKVDGVGKAVEGVGQKVDNVGKAVEGVGQKVDAMHSDMNKHFDHMAQRYDLIATSLVKAIDRMDRNSKMTDKAIEQSRKEAAASNRELAKAVNFMIKKLSGKPPTARRGNRKKRK